MKKHHSNAKIFLWAERERQTKAPKPTSAGIKK
jgi:hypothetical protein